MMTHDMIDALQAHLERHWRHDLLRYLPAAGDDEYDWDLPSDDFWLDVLARFQRGEWQDAVTAIERTFEPRRSQKDDWERIQAGAGA